MLDSLVTVTSGAWWSYPLIAFLAAFDSILPVLPSETAVVTAWIIAAHGGLLLPVVLIAAAAGAFAGDNLAYWIGRKGQRTARRWLLRGDKGQRAINWAARTLDRHGGSVLVVGRFIPGGRTAITVGSGIANFPWRRFAAYDAVGAVTWAAVNSVIGYVGGKAFEDQTWLAFLVSCAAAVLVGAVVELVRWAAARRHTGRNEAAAASRGRPPRTRQPGAATDPARRSLVRTRLDHRRLRAIFARLRPLWALPSAVALVSPVSGVWFSGTGGRPSRAGNYLVTAAVLERSSAAQVIGDSAGRLGPGLTGCGLAGAGRRPARTAWPAGCGMAAGRFLAWPRTAPVNRSPGPKAWMGTAGTGMFSMVTPWSLPRVRWVR